MSLWVKRTVDFIAALSALIVLSPVLAGVMLVVRVKLGRPVLFRQMRPGLHTKPITVIKFRTMLDATDKDGQPLSDEERMTSIGATLRRLSLDELPQLWNVVRGDLSLVGPRPLLTEYLPLYSSEQARRHEMRPGITGWAQVNGRNAISWDEKLALDIWYVENWSLALDVRILLRTVAKVVRREGIAGQGSVTMKRFTGSAVSGEHL